jgi:hypothetical protein
MFRDENERWALSELDGVRSQKTALFIATSVRTSNGTKTAVDLHGMSLT